MKKSELKTAKTNAEKCSSMTHYYSNESEGEHTIAIELDDGHFQVFDELEEFVEFLQSIENW